MLAPRARARSILCPVVPPPTPSRPSKVAATFFHPPSASIDPPFVSSPEPEPHLPPGGFHRSRHRHGALLADRDALTPCSRAKKEGRRSATDRARREKNRFISEIRREPTGTSERANAHLRRRRRPRREARRPSRSPERRPIGTRRRRRDEDVSLNRGGANARRRRRRRSIDRICRLLQNELSKKWRERDRNRSTRGTPPRCARRRASTYLSPHGDAKLPGIETFLMKRVGRSSQSIRAEKARRRRDPRAARATFASSGTVFRKPKNRRESKSTTRAPSEQTCA
jgi:hypothetical protein